LLVHDPPFYRVPRVDARTYANQNGNVNPTFLIALGLILLIAAAWLPAAPVLSAMGLIALGTTQITASRYRGTSSFLQLLILHAATYACLYGLFVGAVFDAALRTSATRSVYWTALDLVVSVVPVAMAARAVFVASRQSASSPQ
jgi:hypothetical protein